MDDSDINGIFRDYEYKVTGKKGVPETKREPVRQLEEEDEVKERYRKAESKLMEKNPKDSGSSRAPPGNIAGYERFAYIGIIAALAVYISFGLFQGSDGADKEETVTAAAINSHLANKTVNKAMENASKPAESPENASEEEQGSDEAAAENEGALSGRIVLTLDEIDAEVIDADSDKGQINKVVFTIGNGKDRDLKPVIDVYAYDSKLDPSWETASRGQYKGAAIKPGDAYSGSIGLVPKTFKNLELKKSIRLSLNDTEDGFITSVNEQISIS